MNATEVNVNTNEENEVVGDVNAEADVVNEEEVNAHQVNQNEAPINENAGTQFSYNNTEGVGCREEDVNTAYVHPNGYISEEDEDGQIDETNESDSTDLSDQDEQDASEKQSCNERLQFDTNQPHFILGMTFANAAEARQAIETTQLPLVRS